MTMVFSKQRFAFVCRTIEKLKSNPKTWEHSEKYLFPIKCFENAVLREKYFQQNQGKWARETKQVTFYRLRQSKK